MSIAAEQQESGSSAERPARNGRADVAVVQLRDIGLVRVIDDLERQLDLALNLGPRTVVVDMSEIPEVSSTTVSALLWIKRRCVARGIGVLLRRPSRRSLETLDRVGLLRVLMVEAADHRGGPLG